MILSVITFSLILETAKDLILCRSGLVKMKIESGLPLETSASAKCFNLNKMSFVLEIEAQTTLNLLRCCNWQSIQERIQINTIEGGKLAQTDSVTFGV